MLLLLLWLHHVGILEEAWGRAWHALPWCLVMVRIRPLIAMLERLSRRKALWW